MTTPPPPPAAVPPEDPLTHELVAQGYRIAFTTDGGEPTLAARGGQLRGYARTGRAPGATAVEVLLTAGREQRPFAAEPLEIAADSSVRIVPLHAVGEREWFSVVEAPAGADASAGPPPRRVQLLERSGGHIKVLAKHDSWAHQERTQIRHMYTYYGETAVVQLGASLYAVANGRVLVLDGPGADAHRFEERSDPDCPPGKRCYMLRAEVDVKQFVGYAPSGRSFVIAGEGEILRRDVATGAKVAYGYQNFFYTGIVEEEAVVLAHAGEPPFVARWTPAKPRPPSPSPPLPLPPGGRATKPPPDAVQQGDMQRLVEGKTFVQLAQTKDGALYGVTEDGSLEKIADGQAEPAVRLPAGHKVVAVGAADKLAFVVVNDAAPPVYHIVM